MSHRLGSVVSMSPSLVIGPDSGSPATTGRTWQVNFSLPPHPDGTKFLMLHFTGATLTGDDVLEVDLGYDVDRFNAAAGTEFWTRPIAGNSVVIRYIDDGVGVAEGSVTLDKYGRGEGIRNGGNTTGGGNANGDVFLLESPFVNPTFFNSSGVCPSGASPSWENVAGLPPGIMQNTARGVGMIIMEHEGSLSSCSAALIDADLILTAGHCISTDAEAASGAFTLDFQTNSDNTRPASYNPKFYKLKRVVKSGFVRAVGDSRPRLDYSIIQIAAPPGGIGVPPLLIRADAPALGEELFIVHHPRGATKKISRQPVDPNCRVLSTPASSCPTGVPPGTELYYAGDSDNGSSGSPVFDAMGRIVAVNDWACGPCDNRGQRATSILQDFLAEPPPPRDVDVVLVFDRSGSMSLPGLGGLTKIQEARQAAALFIDLLRTTATHRAGLVSFSTTPLPDFALAPVTAANKNTLIGPPPGRNTGLVGGLSPGGLTTIGGGLRTAQMQFPTPGPATNTPAILLMTDGLQNTPPMIAEVEAELGAAKLCIIGFGTEASLDGPLLTRLARDHSGIYTRAGEGLELKKFFVLCFGNIFETGISLDPFFVLPANETAARPIPLHVCGEDTLTVVLGWQHADAGLVLSLATPAGATVTNATPGVVASSGDTWSYLRLQLPFNSERDGAWKIQVSRPGGGGEFPPPLPEERFFITAVVNGGPYFRPIPPRRYYTGDTINPQVMLMEPSGAQVPASVTVEVTTPGEGTGNILTKNGLGQSRQVDGDQLEPRSSMLIALEQERGHALIPTTTQTFSLFDDGEHEDGAMEPDGIFGNPLNDLTRFEGNYTFHARATFGSGCTTSRETSWSVYIAVGIDPNNTEVKTEVIATQPDGRQQIRITFTPRDRYGNYLGPGRLDGFEVHGQPGSDLIGGVSDNGDGSYIQEVVRDPGTDEPPTIVISQPERPPVIVHPPRPNGKCKKWKYLFWGALILLILLIVLCFFRC